MPKMIAKILAYDGRVTDRDVEFIRTYEVNGAPYVLFKRADGTTAAVDVARAVAT